MRKLIGILVVLVAVMGVLQRRSVANSTVVTLCSRTTAGACSQWVAVTEASTDRYLLQATSKLNETWQGDVSCYRSLNGITKSEIFRVSGPGRSQEVNVFGGGGRIGCDVLRADRGTVMISLSISGTTALTPAPTLTFTPSRTPTFTPTFTPTRTSTATPTATPT